MSKEPGAVQLRFVGPETLPSRARIVARGVGRHSTGIGCWLATDRVQVEAVWSELSRHGSGARPSSVLSQWFAKQFPGGASRLAALLLGHRCPICSLVAPGQTGAAPGTYSANHCDRTLGCRVVPRAGCLGSPLVEPGRCGAEDQQLAMSSRERRITGRVDDERHHRIDQLGYVQQRPDGVPDAHLGRVSETVGSLTTGS